MSTRPIEVANHHKPPPTGIGNGLTKPNPSPALSPGKVGLQHRRPATSHRRPCCRLSGCRSRPRRSEKPTAAFSTPRLTARRRRPPHPAVRRRPQRRRKNRVVGRRRKEQRRKGASAAGRRPPAAEPPHEKPSHRPTRCRRGPPAGDHPEQAAPLPHHPGPVVAAAGPAPIRPPYKVAPPWNPRSDEGIAGSGRPTTRRRGQRPTPVSCSNDPRRPHPPRSTGAKRMKAPPPPCGRAESRRPARAAARRGSAGRGGSG
jgi:hypothetical protein